MKEGLKKAWADMVQPMLVRPRLSQVAALCMRGEGKNRKVLLVTSRGTGRWIIPKGWPMVGKSNLESALIEAWEEAGVKKAAPRKEPFGTYMYGKVMEGGVPVPVEVQVFLMRVDKLSRAYPEMSERKRKWLRPDRAAELVDEPGLQALLHQLKDKH
ncbi:NUDIX hydrolase [Thalassovita sp.]|uniref:NUDIX hydrolase n=1 Tax=Thalassovita sp. TaxID=1979401 RepID=UPI0029DE8B8C|nr:NUDIX hydrolase [Thalassovita sp.]